MADKEKEEISPKLEALNTDNSKNTNDNQLDSLSIAQSLKVIEKKRSGCYFPSAHVILLILEVLIFILTFIIPKGKYDCIKYDEEREKFYKIIYNKTSSPTEILLENVTQTTLDNLKIKIKLENFLNGYVMDDVAIPGTYHHLEEAENLNFMKLFTYPLYGLIDSADIAFFLMMIAGCLNILIEMKSFLAAMEALSRFGKYSGIILLCCVYFILSIGGSALGFEEEILAFYPALMPAYIRCGIDGALAAASIYFGSIVGNMFSTLNPFGTVIGSYLAGVNFIDGIAFRVVAFILGDGVVIGYFIYYHITVTKHPEKSVVFKIRDEIRNKVLKEDENNNDEDDGKNENLNGKDKKNKVEVDRKNSEYSLNDYNSITDSEDDEEQQLKETKLKYIEFTLIQKISLILFVCAFIVMIIGVTVLRWWFEEMGSVFFILGIILIILSKKGEKEGIEIFSKGAGDFVNIILIIGIARGINLTLDEGFIEDTILYALSGIVDGMNKIVFAILIFIIYIILGFFIQNGTGLAVISIPVFAPLCDEVGVSKNILVNAFMYGQNMIEFISPTGLSLIVSQIVGMKYIHWLRFVWKVMIPLFILIIILSIVDAVIES